MLHVEYMVGKVQKAKGRGRKRAKTVGRNGENSMQ